VRLTIPLELIFGPDSNAETEDFGLSGPTATFGSLSPGTGHGTVVIPDGQSSALITLTPVNDIQAEANQILTLDLVADAAYTIGTNANATVTIAANDFVVTNKNDEEEGSLRQAVRNANSIAGDDTITFDTTLPGSPFASATPAVPAVITLTTGHLAVTSSLTIQGLGARVLHISGNNTSRVLDVAGVGVNVTLDALTIRNGALTDQFGAGIRSASTGLLSITRSTIRDNVITNTGGLVESGAGLVVIVGPLAIRETTVSGNRANAANGGGISISSPATIVNSTFSGNSAAQGGGMFLTSGNISLVNVTVTGNSATSSGGGIVSSPGALANFGNVIVAQNTAPTAPDVQQSGTINSQGGNLIGSNDGAGAFIAGTPSVNGDFVGTSISPIDARLDLLADNGGPTDTRTLLAGSPALNAGLTSHATNAALTTDQRGPGFVRLIGPSVDSGAVEALAYTPTVVAATVNEDTLSASGLVITPNTSDSGGTTHFKITNILNGTLFKNDGTTPIANNTFLTLTEGAEGLKFKPASNLNSTNTAAGFHFDVQASTSALDAGLKPAVTTVNITVNAVNDDPTVVSLGIPDLTIVTTQVVNVPLTPHFTDIEDGSAMTYTVSGNNSGAAASAIINGNGTGVDITGLQSGVTSVTIQAKDSGNAVITDSFTVLVLPPNPTTPGIAAKPILKAQTGMFEVPVVVTNPHPVSINGFRLRITNPHPALKLMTATSPIGSAEVYADHAYPVGPGDKVTMTLVFFSSTRTWPANYVPAIAVEVLMNPPSTESSSKGVAITRVVEQVDGSMLLEWPAVTGRWYRVKFSADLVTWRSSLVPIKAAATRVQWFDKGPPFTDVHPNTLLPAASRFYKVEAITP
jgi:hypothetical protein